MNQQTSGNVEPESNLDTEIPVEKKTHYWAIIILAIVLLVIALGLALHLTNSETTNFIVDQLKT